MNADFGGHDVLIISLLQCFINLEIEKHHELPVMLPPRDVGPIAAIEVLHLIRAQAPLSESHRFGGLTRSGIVVCRSVSGKPLYVIE